MFRNLQRVAGEFTCDADRLRVATFVQAALDNKLRRLEAAGNMDLFRHLVFPARVLNAIRGLVLPLRECFNLIACSKLSQYMLQAACAQSCRTVCLH